MGLSAWGNALNGVLPLRYGRRRLRIGSRVTDCRCAMAGEVVGIRPLGGGTRKLKYRVREDNGRVSDWLRAELRNEDPSDRERYEVGQRVEVARMRGRLLPHPDQGKRGEVVGVVPSGDVLRSCYAVWLDGDRNPKLFLGFELRRVWGDNG